MSLYNTYNNEDILSRAVIAGMLGVLNQTMTYKQVWANDDIQEVNIPWFYNQSGDERFMQDFYTHYADCEFPKPADGNFDVIQRGILTYTGSDIDAQRITNRFVQGRYLKEVDGKLQSFVSFLYSIPLTVRFDCEMWLDTQVTALKVEQAIRETFYKTVTFYVYYKGMRLGCTSGFSEDIAIDKMIEYSFEEDNKIKINFTIEVETYQPVFDPTTEMDAGNYMKGIGYRLYEHDEKDDGAITITTPKTNAIIPKGNPLMIEWTYVDEGAIIHDVDFYWLVSGTNDWNLIEKGVYNNEFWYWNIPEDFTDYKEPKIIWEETDDVKVYREPVIDIIPNLTTNVIDASSFTIIDPGYFMAEDTDSSIAVILEMKNDAGVISYSTDDAIWFKITNYKLDPTTPVYNMDDITFPGTVDYKIIDIHVANSVNTDVFGPVRNITIV